MTISESRFISFCQARGYATQTLDRLPNAAKTADFSVIAGSVSFYVEIKELRDTERSLEPPAEESAPVPLDDRLRRILHGAALQLRSYRSQHRPAIIVLHDCRSATNNMPLNAKLLQSAMFDPSPRKTHALNKGPFDAPFTAERHTFVSAVSILLPEPSLAMCTYHNCFAESPLPQTIFSAPADRHYFLKSGGTSAAEWTADAGGIFSASGDNDATSITGS
jgi:hypothetical protein